MKYGVLILAAAMLLSAACPAQSQPDRLYQAIIKEGSLGKKREMGRQLGRLGTAEARTNLLKLLDDGHYWNQLAAAEGLFHYKDLDTRRRLVREMLDNHMVRDDVGRGIQDRLQEFWEAMASVYGEEKDAKKREILLTTLAGSGTPKAESFLKGLVADAKSPDRKAALKLLAEKFPDDYKYYHGLVDDPELRLLALGCLIERGSEKDLPLFTGIIRQGGEDAEMIVSYQAVAKWGDDGQKEGAYLGALASGNEVLARGGMLSFRGLYGPEIARRLGQLARSAKDQRTRMAAGTRLAELGGKEAVSFLVPLLDEEYSEQRSATFNAIASVMTAGIWTVLDGLSLSYNRKSFEASRSAILSGLRRIARDDAGKTYREWKDWAVYHGHSIDGANIVQYLFSDYPKTRSAAADAGAKLLGYKNARAFADKNRVPDSGAELAMALARKLIEAGYMKEGAD